MDPLSSLGPGGAGPSKKKPHPNKRWCFTLNNPTEQELAHIKKSLTTESALFAIVGKEKGDKGAPHLQGFVNLITEKRLAGMKSLISERAHFEIGKDMHVRVAKDY